MKKLLDRIRRGAASLVQRLKDWLGVEEPQVAPGEAAPQPGTFLAASIASDGWNRRSYRLYVPNGIGTTPVPLIVMLHGCRQTAESFAQGTRMNDIADARRFLVLYPSQSRLSNPLGCWNWFLPRNQGRTGEPAEIMRLVDEIASGWPVDPKRVFVAGLSAGGAMAETLGRNYPERLAAIAVHSALPGDAALSVKDALAAMESGARHASPSPQVPVMLFHGARDATVTIDNAEAMLAAARAAHPDAEEAVFPAGESTRLTLVTRERPVMEYWRIPALAHAWSGGDPEGGYADAEGPDASAEIVRFFLDTVAGSARALRAGNRVPA